MLKDVDLRHQRRSIELATEALEAGDEPFGTVLVDGNGDVLADGRNRRARNREGYLNRSAAGPCNTAN